MSVAKGTNAASILVENGIGTVSGDSQGVKTVFGNEDYSGWTVTTFTAVAQESATLDVGGKSQVNMKIELAAASNSFSFEPKFASWDSTPKWTPGLIDTVSAPAVTDTTDTTTGASYIHGVKRIIPLNGEKQIKIRCTAITGTTKVWLCGV